MFSRTGRKGGFCLSPLALSLHPAEMAAVEMAVLPFSTLGWERWEQPIVCRDAHGQHGEHTGSRPADLCPVASHPPSPPKYAPSLSGEAEESPKVLLGDGQVIQGAGATRGVGSNVLGGKALQTEGDSTSTSHPCLSLPSGRRGGSSRAIHCSEHGPCPPAGGLCGLSAAPAPSPQPVPAALPGDASAPPAPAGRRPALGPG